MASSLDRLHRAAWALALSGVAPMATGMEAGPPLLISHTTSGEPTGGICFLPTLSPTGRFTAYSCYSFDILPGQPGVGDGLMHDAQTGAIIGLSYDEQGD